MGRCRYLAIDYETEFANKRRNLLERLTVKHIGHLPEQQTSSSKALSHRKPWTRAKKECIESVSSDDTTIVEDLKILDTHIGQKNLNGFEYLFFNKGRTVEESSGEKFTELRTEDVCGTSTVCFELEEIESAEALRKWRPSTNRLLRKYNAMILSDPHEEIKTGYQHMESLNVPDNLGADSLKTDTEFAAFEELDSNQNIFSDISVLEVDETFIQEQKLPQLTKERYPELPTQKLSHDETSETDKDLDLLIKSQSGFKSVEELPCEPVHVENDLDCLDVCVKEGEKLLEMEQPTAPPRVQKDIESMWNEAAVLDVAKISVTDTLQSDLQKLVKDKEISALEQEDCNAVRVSKLLLSETKVEQVQLRGIDGEKVPSVCTLCQEHSTLPTADIELALSWSVTQHTGNMMVTNLQRPEKLECRKAIVEKATEKKSHSAYFIEGEVFEKLEPAPLSEETPTVPEATMLSTRDVVAGSAGWSKKPSNSFVDVRSTTEIISNGTTTKVQKTAENLQSLKVPQPVPSTCKQRNDKESPTKLPHSMHNTSSLDMFLQLRGLTKKPKDECFDGPIAKTNPTVKKTPTSSGLREKEKSKPSFTPKPMVLVESKPAESNYKAIKVHVTGGLLRMIVDLESFIEPVYGELKKIGTIPRDSDPRSLKEDMSKYLLNEAKKYIQLSGIDVEKHPSYVLLVILHCFVLSKSRLLNLSAKSALGFLAEFYKNKKKMLECLMQNDDSGRSNSVLSLIPLACHSLKNALSNTNFIHPKIHELVRVVHERFTKDIKRGGKLTKILVLCSTYCQYLFEQLEEILKNLTFEESQSMAVKAVGLSPPAHQRFCDDVLAEAIKRDFNVIIVPTCFISPTFPWKSFSLLLEYEGRQDSPWKRISSEMKIKHIAFETESFNGAMDLSEGKTSGKVEEEDSTTLIGSTTIAKCGNLLHLLEARYNITIIERDCDNFCHTKNPYGENSDLGSSAANTQPDLIIDRDTCVVVETFAALNGEDGGEAVQKISCRLVDLGLKFTKSYVIISDMSAKNSSYPMKGDFPLNLAKLHTIVNGYLKKNATFEMTVFCSFDLEHFAQLISQLVERFRRRQKDKTSTRAKLSLSASGHESFLTQFPSINAVVAQEMLAVLPLRQIATKTLPELKECFPNIQEQYLQDFHDKLHANANIDTEFSDGSQFSDVDVTPDFSFQIDDEFELSQQNDSSDFASRFAQNFKNSGFNQADSDDPSTSFRMFSAENSHYGEEARSVPVSNPCRKRLRFERIKEWKDGQTRLTLS